MDELNEIDEPNIAVCVLMGKMEVDFENIGPLGCS
jgi:hypothetical protein